MSLSCFSRVTHLFCPHHMSHIPFTTSFIHESFTRALKLIFAPVHSQDMFPNKTHLDITVTEMSNFV